MHDRKTLHVAHLDAFAAFCAARGWVRENAKGAFEVLRMRKAGESLPLLVYRKGKNAQGGDIVHYTVYGHSLGLALDFYDRRRNKAVPSSSGD